MGRGQTRGGALVGSPCPSLPLFPSPRAEHERLPPCLAWAWPGRAPRKHELLLVVAAARPNAVRPRGLRTQRAWRGTSAPPSCLCV